MPQSEMEALLPLQKETIESLRQLVDSQRLTIEQMAKSHEEQTAQLNQTIANLNETVEYLKKRLFASSSEKIKKDEFPGQMDLFNEAEAAADPSVPEPALEEAVSGYNRQTKETKGHQGRDPGRASCDRSPLHGVRWRTGTAHTVIPRWKSSGKRLSARNCGSLAQRWNGSSMSRKCSAARSVRKTSASVIVQAETPSPLLKHSLASPSTVAYVMYQKYVNSIPLYRQEADWKQLGVKLPRATLANWVIKCGMGYMEPVYKLLHETSAGEGQLSMRMKRPARC